MEVAGSLGFPVPRPQPLLAVPRPEPRIAAGYLEAVLVELTRPSPSAFMVRIFDEDFTPPEADVVAVSVFYGVDAASIGRRLEAVWKSLGLRAEPQLRYASYRTYGHPGEFARVLRTIETLQGSFLP